MERRRRPQSVGVLMSTAIERARQAASWHAMAVRTVEGQTLSSLLRELADIAVERDAVVMAYDDLQEAYGELLADGAEGAL